MNVVTIVVVFAAFDYENHHDTSETITSTLNVFANGAIELNNNDSKETDDINNINDDNDTLCSDLSDRDLTISSVNISTCETIVVSIKQSVHISNPNNVFENKDGIFVDNNINIQSDTTTPATEHDCKFSAKKNSKKQSNEPNEPNEATKEGKEEEEDGTDIHYKMLKTRALSRGASLSVSESEDIDIMINEEREKQQKSEENKHNELGPVTSVTSIASVASNSSNLNDTVRRISVASNTSGGSNSTSGSDASSLAPETSTGGMNDLSGLQEFKLTSSIKDNNNNNMYVNGSNCSSFSHSSTQNTQNMHSRSDGDLIENVDISKIAKIDINVNRPATARGNVGRRECRGAATTVTTEIVGTTRKRTFSERIDINGELSVIPSGIENGIDASSVVSVAHSIASHSCSSTFNGDFGALSMKSFYCRVNALGNNSSSKSKDDCNNKNNSETIQVTNISDIGRVDVDRLVLFETHESNGSEAEAEEADIDDGDSSVGDGDNSDAANPSGVDNLDSVHSVDSRISEGENTLNHHQSLANNRRNKKKIEGGKTHRRNITIIRTPAIKKMIVNVLYQN